MNRALLPLLLLPLLGSAPAPDPARLEIALAGLRSTNGDVRLCIWHSPKRFPDGKCEGEGQQIIVRAAAQVAVSVPLAPGDYAVSLLHDENGNGKLDKNLLGIPKEGVGFSQNPKLAFGPPSYAATRFDVTGDTVETIKLKYFL
ncbi:DUF2141 domain-containing protein [Glacieibacterium frigidum]|uniref:DUF2141 domain-containing protein n=1 Tax=Glacieibacterium frigidum TaxID=2593303 RepID=A0A552UG22_9SPHN|nr:DUF2141 domain-containing protein [Glacieibacterium frigidum]TRW17172.1 DUF2141 domain-containing protein [Glacieibacterium frigidum]